MGRIPTPEEMDKIAAREQWRREKATHRFVTLDGEEYVCTWCDSKTGNGICPGDGTQYIDEHVLGSKQDRGEPQPDWPDTPDAIERPF